MRIRIRQGLVSAALLVPGAFISGQTAVKTSTEFVGTTPCNEMLRAFLGGIAAHTSCPAVMWRLDLGGSEANGPGWTISAAYSAPTQSNPILMKDRGQVSARGKLEKTGTTYRLISSTGRSISFRDVAGTLVHLLDEKDHLLNGSGAYSFTLNRVDAMDDPGRPAQLSEGSYSLSPRESGDSVFGEFGGRTPCMGLARALRLTLKDGCERVKWRITLRQNPRTHEPTTYNMQGSLHHPGRQGAWRIVRGTPTNKGAVVYQLDGTATEGPLLLMKGDDDVLFMLDDRWQPLVGTGAFSYTLNRTR